MLSSSWGFSCHAQTLWILSQIFLSRWHLQGLLNLDLAIRLLSELPSLSPQPQPTHSFPSLVLPSSITKPVRIFPTEPCAASRGFSLPGPGSPLLLTALQRTATSFSAFPTHAATRTEMCVRCRRAIISGQGVS